MQKRLLAWERLGSDLDKSLLESMITEIDFDGLPTAARDLLDGKLKGRLVVKIPQ